MLPDKFVYPDVYLDPKNGNFVAEDIEQVTYAPQPRPSAAIGAKELTESSVTNPEKFIFPDVYLDPKDGVFTDEDVNRVTKSPMTRPSAAVEKIELADDV